MILLGLGVAIAVAGAILLADEWRRAGTQNARVNGDALRVELLAAGAVIIGLGVAMAYAGVGA